MINANQDSQYQCFLDFYGIQKSFESREVFLGGTYGNYSDNYLHELEPDENQNIIFDEFNNLLVKICPNLTSIEDYKNIYYHCITEVERGESDYYGGDTFYKFLKCDTKLLYDILLKMNIINS